MASKARIEYLDGQRIVTKAPPWHNAVTFDLMLSSISSGTFIVAAILLLISPLRFRVLAIVGFFVAFLVEIADLISLVIDLGDALRFHHMLRTFKPRSPMSVGVWLSSGLATFAFIAVVLSLSLMRGNLGLIGALQAVAAVGLLFALGVATYKGVLLSATAQPVWGQMRWLGAVLSISSGTCGLAVMLTASTAYGDEAASAALRFAAGVVLALYTVVLAFAFATINHALAPRMGRRRIIFWNLLAILIGGAIPATLALLPRYAAGIDYLILATTILGGLALRHVLITIPHLVRAD